MQIMYTQSTCIECLAYNGSIAIAACRNLTIFERIGSILNEIQHFTHSQWLKWAGAQIWMFIPVIILLLSKTRNIF